MKRIEIIYSTLYSYYGDLHWWPADTPFEVMVGAVLTQNTAWNNVEKAIQRFHGKLLPDCILDLSEAELQDIIRPAGFYRQKSLYLKAVSEWFLRYDGDVNVIRSQPQDTLRKELLSVKGIGNETADSILLYAFDLPSFVVDAYTMRLFGRFPVDAGKTYTETKRFCEAALPHDAGIYRHFHALIVQNGKDHCKKIAACCGCPLYVQCKKKLLSVR